jgi:hypothetical protein
VNEQTTRPAAEVSARVQGERPYVPIRDYALIGDCHGAALVATDGSIDWCCLGRFDAGPAFWRILDAAKGGSFQVCPETKAEAERAYIAGTNILRTLFTTPSGRVSVTDFMPVGCAPGVAADDYVTLNSPGWLIRTVEGIAGQVRIRVRYQQPKLPFDPTAEHANGRTILHTFPTLVQADEVETTIEISPGERHIFVIASAAGSQPEAGIGGGRRPALLHQWRRCCLFSGKKPSRELIGIR